MADAFVVIYDAIVDGTNPALGHGPEGYYFTSHDEVSAYVLAKEIGSALVKLGKAKSPEPTAMTQEELDKHLSSLVSSVIYWSIKCLIIGFGRFIFWEVPRELRRIVRRR